ncbi:MAG: DUF3604 domain-containing protein [Promethearchaeota archaeon]
MDGRLPGRTGGKGGTGTRLRRGRRSRLFLLAKVALVVFTLGFWSFTFLDFGVASDNEVRSLWGHAPTVVEQGVPFTLTVEAWDSYERLAGGFTGTVALSLESFDAGDFHPLLGASWWANESEHAFTSNFAMKGLAPAYHYPGADNGKATFSAWIETPGVHYFVLTYSSGGAVHAFRSNPVWVVPRGSTDRFIYWGDIHGHTLYSDGSGVPRETYRFARDVSMLDFAALTEHTEFDPRFGEVDLSGQFARYVATTQSFNEPGRFVTLLAEEYTPMLTGVRTYLSTGHVNLYFRGDDMPFISSLKLGDPYELFETVRGLTDDPFVGWFHHTTREAQCADFGYYDPSVNRMVEVYSCHGSSEMAGSQNWYPEVHELPADEHGYSISDALKMGYRLGFMASSDTHDGRLGHSIFHTRARALNQYPFSLSAYRYGVHYPGGLTAVYCAKLNRSDVFDALEGRSAYATTWVNRPLVTFSVNGVEVGEQGSEVTVSAKDTPRTVTLFVAADGVALQPNQSNAVRVVDVFKNSELWKHVEVDATMGRWTWVDDEPVTGTSYTGCVQKADGQWYVNQQSRKPVDPASLSTNGTDYYYARVQDANYQAAWIGPVWVRPLA